MTTRDNWVGCTGYSGGARWSSRRKSALPGIASITTFYLPAWIKTLSKSSAPPGLAALNITVGVSAVLSVAQGATTVNQVRESPMFSIVVATPSSLQGPAHVAFSEKKGCGRIRRIRGRVVHTPPELS